MNLKEKLKTAIRRLVGTERLANRMLPQLSEIRYSVMFHDSIIDSEWYKYKQLSLGAFAIDYGTAYVIYNVLERMQPKSIIEMGLGQSSKIIHQYATYYKTSAVTIEHDADWVNFFLSGIAGKYDVNIQMARLEYRMYNGSQNLVYETLPLLAGNNKYDFVFIDGPFGTQPNGKCYSYARLNIIDIIEKNLLSPSFCIIMHDYQRSGEQNTISEVLNLLDKQNKSYCIAEYEAMKKCILICSNDLQFLASL